MTDKALTIRPADLADLAALDRLAELDSASAAAENDPCSATALRTRSCLTSNITSAYRS